MAVTTQNSTEYGNTLAVPKVLNATNDAGGRLRIARFSFTQSGAGDATSIANLVKLPAGKVRVLLRNSWVVVSAFGASRTLDLGWAAHNSGADGSAVAADADGLDAAQDVSSALAYNPIGTIGGDETKLFDSAAGVLINATVAGGTIPAAATIKGYLIYIQD